MTKPTVTLTPRATRAAQRGRPWHFEEDLANVDAAHGDLVRAVSDRGAPLGVGLYSDRSRIRLRLCGGAFSLAPPPVAEFFGQRLAASIERRAHLRQGDHSGARLVHAEADGLPGLIVDAYGDVVVLQISAAAVEVHRDAIVDALRQLLEPAAIVARHDIAVRAHEGLEQGVELLFGEQRDSVTIEEHGVLHEVRPFDGHKTGYYLDQRLARARVKELASGRRVLDVFSYQGGFALAALAGGASSALAIDQSEPALTLARSGAARNGLDGLETRAANAFDALRELRAAGELYDLIVVDPPPFAKSKRELQGGKRGYRDLNRLALRLLAPNGLLLTCSCSHHLTSPMFEDLLRQAAARVPFRVYLRERVMAGEDHPAWISLPESEYLKSFLLHRIDL